MGDNIPGYARATCEFCHEPVNIRMTTGGVYQYTSGWVMLRGGGGGHGVSLPQRENRWAHAHCINLEISKGQRGLL